jgi:hypothetical protein
MSATVLTTVAPGVRPTLELYRDDGPLGRLLGRFLGHPRVPAELLVVLALAPLAVLLVSEQEDVARLPLGAAVAWAVIAGGASSGCSHLGRFAWAVPTLLRMLEYGTLVWMARTESADAVPGAFVLLCAIAFRHYDIVYRLRHRREPPPDWVNWVGLGWEGRLLLVYVLVVAGTVPWSLYALAVLLAAVSVTESALVWVRASARGMEDDDDEDLTP